MALLVRVGKPDGSNPTVLQNPIVLQNASNIQEFQTVNSSDEGCSFDLPIDDPKYDREFFYTLFWEIWDTAKNERRNFGPIHDISESDTSVSVNGPGRSQLLEDRIMSKYTWYWPVIRLLNDIRYENNAAAPRTTTEVYEPGSSKRVGSGGTKWWGLSKYTKDNAIDEVITPGVETGAIRMATFHTTDNFWSGTDRADTIVVDLHETVPVTRLSFLFPWWGGPARWHGRVYSYNVSYSQDNSSWTNIISRDEAALIAGGAEPLATVDKYLGHYYYTDITKEGHELQIYAVSPFPAARYWKLDITQTYAYYNVGAGAYDIIPTYEDRWSYQCGELLPDTGINARALDVTNDCHASVVEMGLYSEIIGRDELSSLTYLQIDNDNRQIYYNHTVDSFELKTTSDGFVIYEPGATLRKARVTWTGATTSFNKFFSQDKDNSIATSNFAIADDKNSVIYRTTLTSGTKDAKLSAYTKSMTIKGASQSNITIESVDTWPSVVNAFSYNNRYAYSIHAGDTAILHFRGKSLKWYISVPEGATAGTAKLELRTRTLDGAWSAYTTLQSSLTLPTNVFAELAYEIPFDSSILDTDKISEFKITNLNGGYVSIDSFAGYWYASWIDFNEDHERWQYRDDILPWQQIYDPRFSGGSMMKTHAKGAFTRFDIEGDRVQILSTKAPNAGKMTILLRRFNFPAFHPTLPIPGGEANGTVIVDLDTGSKGHIIPQYIAFDSDDYFVASGLPWDKYQVYIRLEGKNYEEYNVNINPIDNPLSYSIDCDNCSTAAKATSGGVTKVGKPIFIDGIGAHTITGISTKFTNETHLSVLKSVSEVIQHEWRITEKGLKVVPRIGSDTEVIMVVSMKNVLRTDINHDVQKVTSQLLASGGDIDGLPLFTITEDKRNKEILGRTIMRTQDYRNLTDYFMLIGASRVELRRRRYPEQRISITWAGNLEVDIGDSFILKTRARQERVRLIKLTQSQNDNGLTYQLECIPWPLIT